MRIGFFVPFFPQLSETFVIDQAAEFVAAGHDVRIYCLSGAQSGRVHQAVGEHQLLERTTWLMSPDRHRHDKVVRAALRAIRHFPASIGPLRTVLRENVGRRMKIPTAAAGLGLLSNGEQLPRTFDVIQAHFGPMGLVVDGLREMGLVNGPLVVTFHGGDLLVGRNQDRYGPLYQRAERMTANSTFLLEKLRSDGAPADKAMRLPVGVDLDAFQLRPAPGGPSKFLTVARLTEGKDVATGIRAFARLTERGRKVRYTIIGTGPLRRELESLAESLDIADRVRFAGSCAHEDVLNAFHDHHILVHPGKEARSGWVEAQGLVLVEAQAVGMPVVAAEIGGIQETVGKGAGLLVPPEDPGALAEALDTMLARRGEWDAIGRLGRRHAESHFDRQTLLDQLLAVYRELAWVI